MPRRGQEQPSSISLLLLALVLIRHTSVRRTQKAPVPPPPTTPPQFPTHIDGKLQQRLNAAEEAIWNVVAKKELSDSARFALSQFAEITNADMIRAMPGLLKLTGMPDKDIKAFTDALLFRANNEWTPQLVRFLHAKNHLEQLPQPTPAPDQDTTPPDPCDLIGAYNQCDAYGNSSARSV